MKPINIIVAVDEAGGFGKNGELPWHFKKDFEHFKQTTKDAVCIMGRKTYEEIVEKSKARKTRKGKKTDLLPGRKCFVLTRNEDTKLEQGCVRFGSLRDAVTEAEKLNKKVFVIGGEKLFIEAMTWTNTIYMTIVEGIYGCDRFFPIKALTKWYNIVDGKKVKEKDKELKIITYKRRGS
jgi:dihydrofolate reductase